MAKNDILTLDKVRQTFEYEPDTGLFVWKWRDDVGLPWNRKNAGKIAGTVGLKGYVQLMIDRKRFCAHRIAWLFMTGEYPVEDIDHINGIKSDNRFSNLRQASRTENNYNRKIQRNNQVGVKGVYPHRNKFRSQIVVDGETKHLGVFDTVEEAFASYQEAVKKYHGKFAYSERL